MKRLAVVLVAVGLVLPGTVSATFTCPTVARTNGADPESFLFARRFINPAVSQAGDVVFLGRPKGSRSVSAFTGAWARRAS